MKNAKRTAMWVCGCIVAAVAGSVWAQDWPQWRGPNRDAKATGFTAPKIWPKELTAKWKVTVGEGVATPALAGDKLFVFSRQSGNEVTRALDASTGKELWKEEYESLGASGAASGFSGPRSSPAVAGGKVVTLGVRGMLSCLDAATGQKLWRKDDFKAWPQFHPASSPIIVDGLCVVQLGGRNNGAIVAYEMISGEEKWKWTGGSPAYASPVLATVGGTRLIVAQTDSEMVAVRVSDGTVAWQAPIAAAGGGPGGPGAPGRGGPAGRGGGRGGGGGRDYKAATPIVDGQTVIFTGRGVRAVRLEKEADGFIGQELWINPDQSVQFNTPVLKNGLLFGLTPGNEFFCVNAKNGQTAWTASAGLTGGRGRDGFGTIIDAGSVLFALTPGTELVAIEPSDKEYKELARIKVADTPTYAHPVVTGHRIYIKDQDSVILGTLE